MTIWRTMPIKKNEPVVFVPCRHDPAKQFWREFPAVFCQDSGHRPGVVCWIEKLQEKRLKLLDPRRKIHFRISGVQYGDKDFFVNDSFSDSLTFQAGILDEIGRPWQSRIVREIERCEQTAALVGRFAQELAIAAGDRNENAGGAVRAQFYFAVDQPFRQWLQAIDREQDDPDEAALRVRPCRLPISLWVIRSKKYRKRISCSSFDREDRAAARCGLSNRTVCPQAEKA